MTPAVWLAPSAQQAVCPLCGADGGTAGQQAIIEAAHPLPGLPPIRYLRCASCASLFTDPPLALAYDHAGALPDDFLRHYLEVGAGIHAMLHRAWSLADSAGRSLLDVGCGYGFTVDAWQRSQGGVAVGVELAAYGRLGAARLGVTIHDQLLGQIPALAGRRFDRVQAIEVIEHVPDVAAFLADLDAMLAPGGVLILTTPNAGFIQPGVAPAELLALLSPGFHTALFSAEALSAALRRRFAHVEVRQDRETLSAWAAHQPFSRSDGDVDAAYLGYLEQLFAACPADDPLHDGLAYRLFKEKTNRADHAAAGIALQALQDSYRRRYGAAVLEPEAAVRLAQADPAHRALPYALAAYHFFRAMRARLVDNDPLFAARSFHAAAAIALAGGRQQPSFFQEALSLLWIARQQTGLALAAAGELAAARQVFAEILAAGTHDFPIYPGAELLPAVRGHYADVGGA